MNEQSSIVPQDAMSQDNLRTTSLRVYTDSAALARMRTPASKREEGREAPSAGNLRLSTALSYIDRGAEAAERAQATHDATESNELLVLAYVELVDPGEGSGLLTLRDLGVDILGHRLENTYLCRTTLTTLHALRSLRFVSDVIPLTADTGAVDVHENDCAEVIDRLIARFGWKLLARHEFINRTLAEARGRNYTGRGGEDDSATSLSFIASGVYNQALYTACSGAEGPVRRELAYTELSNMLHDRARVRYPDVCADAAQSALEQTYAQFDRCLEPRAFFRFAWYHLMNAARQLRRQERYTLLSLEHTVGVKGVRFNDSVPSPGSNILEHVLNDALYAELRANFDTLVQEHPRAKNQLAAVRLKYLEGVDDITIGQLLGVDVKRVYELRSRGLKKLRDDPHLRSCL